LILLDLGLPKKDGREVLADIRADDILKTIPVVVLTSSDDYGDQLDSESLGVEGYITKPVDLTKFLVVIKRLQRFWREDLVLPAL
jgi:CheY-like chemotaxis protein